MSLVLSHACDAKSIDHSGSKVCVPVSRVSILRCGGREDRGPFRVSFFFFFFFITKPIKQTVIKNSMENSSSYSSPRGFVSRGGSSTARIRLWFKNPTRSCRFSVNNGHDYAGQANDVRAQMARESGFRPAPRARVCCLQPNRSFFLHRYDQANCAFRGRFPRPVIYAYIDGSNSGYPPRRAGEHYSTFEVQSAMRFWRARSNL